MKCAGCAREIEWSDLGEYARQVCNRMLAKKKQRPLGADEVELCPSCRVNTRPQLLLWAKE